MSPALVCGTNTGKGDKNSQYSYSAYTTASLDKHDTSRDILNKAIYFYLLETFKVLSVELFLPLVH